MIGVTPEAGEAGIYSGARVWVSVQIVVRVMVRVRVGVASVVPYLPA